MAFFLPSLASAQIWRGFAKQSSGIEQRPNMVHLSLCVYMFAWLLFRFVCLADVVWLATVFFSLLS